jgi:pimeloyl-ACP methyl ester carboxylesterase
MRSRALIIVGGSVLAVVLLLWALRLDHGSKTALPEPTGPYPVARAIYDWTDPATPDPLAPKGTTRELLVWIWYPADAGLGGATEDEYLPASMRAPVEASRGWLMSKLFTRDLSLVRAHVLKDAAVAPERVRYPVVVMRPGTSAAVWNYSSLAEDLASHGYVVVGFDAPYRTNVVTFPDQRVFTRLPENDPERCTSESGGPARARCVNRVVAAWVDDIGFVLDRLQSLDRSKAGGVFAGRLDLAKVGVFGHSLGGAVAVEFCAQDDRCKTGVDLDGAPPAAAVQTGLHQPFMFLLGEHDGDADTDSVRAGIRSLYDRLPPSDRLLIGIHGASRSSFSDDGALLRSHVITGPLHLLHIVGLSGRRQLAVTEYCLQSFFDAYLTHDSTTRPQLVSREYPEVETLK